MESDKNARKYHIQESQEVRQIFALHSDVNKAHKSICFEITIQYFQVYTFEPVPWGLYQYSPSILKLEIDSSNC